MKRGWLILFTLATFLLTGAALTQATSGQAQAKRSPHNQVRGESTDPLATSVGLRWRLGQPTHWRYMLLKH